LAFLRGILDCFRTLQERYGMRSLTGGGRRRDSSCARTR
jgi:hypothetical protein